ncbi:diadenylate cyclase [Desulfobulbus alkaliphilus]|uniref:diadenylate cyclase n=1 Tax=Desulfobulbus alkaliphilus TaxID=869814 RepID=UPI00196608F0|nr:diadenylate cyclase [Desulfobulbus alkaliphilus]MBM9536352.1 diadenylate cyclase [Desulfobulbus alkaliphilus]
MGHFFVLSHQLFTWQALLDILLISAALFFLYRTLLRLGTWKIMAGILLALLIFILASMLNLKGIEWIYENVSHVAVLGLIVLFQPELRKVFEKAVSVSPGLTKGLNAQFPALIADSLTKLARQRCGAIIVLPGKEPIQDKISGGFRLNAIPSQPLILSIFDTHSPGHDGAVIIEGDKLTQFGVRLPMSQSDRLSEEFGTRHHAAMGLAEQTDSLVLLVSEERGRVSLFANGEMQPAVNSDQIITAIVNHQREMGFFGGEASFRIRKRTLLQTVASLMIALVFWSSLMIAQSEVVERVLPVAIDYAPPGENLVLTGDKANEIQLHLTGPKSVIDSLALDPPSVKIDLSRMGKGIQTIIITSENLRLPRDVTLLDASPQQIKVTLTEVAEKNLPITPQLIGKLPGSLKIKKITVTPATVLVTIPVSSGEKLDNAILTTPIYLESISTDSTLFCKIIARPTIQPVAKRWPDVEVMIEVME